MRKLNEARDIVEQAAARLPVGGVDRDTLCPVCGGGASHERAFSIRRESDGILFKCWRATCSWHGFIGTGRLAVARLPDSPKPKTNPYIGPIEPLPFEVRTMLNETYGLTGGELAKNRVGWSPTLERVLYAILGPRGEGLGYAARSYKGDKPKSVQYWDQDLTKVHFAHNPFPNDEQVFLVEDHVSAMKVARFAPAVALMGVHLVEADAVLISRRFREAVAFLDPGADKAAFGLARKYGLLFRNFFVKTGSKLDPKDMTDQELKEALKR